jgi:hypothetical protein
MAHRTDLIALALLRRLRDGLPAASRALPAVLLFGCTQTGAPPAAPASTAPAASGPGAPAAAPGPIYSLFHRPLRAPEDAQEFLRLHGKGVQIFRCEPRDGGQRWLNKLPEAELRDDAGKLVARLGANQSFEHVDGSRLIGEVVDNVPAPADNALVWLLLKTRSFGKGTLAGTTYVQRIQTVGGMPPEGCAPTQLNQVLRVDFSADFIFFR